MEREEVVISDDEVMDVDDEVIHVDDKMIHVDNEAMIIDEEEVHDDGSSIEEGSGNESLEAGSDAEIVPFQDSDYDSEYSGITRDHRVQHLDTAEILAMDDEVRICSIHVYYRPWSGKMLCMRCFMRFRDLYTEADVVRTHRTGRYEHLLGRWCSDCNGPLDITFIRNMCPVCNSCKY